MSSSTQSLASRFYNIGIVRRFDHWLHAMPHPSVVVEVAAEHVAVARWGSKRGHLDGVAVESLPAGSVMPSPIETNVTQPEAVRAALRRTFNRVPAGGAPIALLIPDQVVRVFILPFDDLPRRSNEALPLLRWRLKKSVPFDVDETVVAWMRQAARDESLEVVTSVARQKIVREYEELIEPLGVTSSVVLSSTLATLPLVEERGATLLVRLSGRTLTTVITRGVSLCVYRSTEMRTDAATLEPQAVLDEVFPAVAYYQDTWNDSIDRARITGFGEREPLFGKAIAEELRIVTGPMSDADGAVSLEGPASDLVSHGLDALVGWMLNSRPGS